MTPTLDWGYEYAVVRPDHYRIDYVINPHMDVRHQPDPAAALRQWQAMIGAMKAAGATVHELDQRADSPDMVYAMNLGMPLRIPVGDRVVMSHMRHDERRNETGTAATAFQELGFAPYTLGRLGSGPYFEAGDAFAWRGDLVVGHGPRTNAHALDLLAQRLNVTVHAARITHPAMYHLDLCFCPLTVEAALICPEALEADSAARMLELVPDPIVLSVDEAMTFAANSIVIGDTVLMPAGTPPRVIAEVEARGLAVVTLVMDEFHLGGGSIRCLTNPMDITVGRDLLLR